MSDWFMKLTPEDQLKAVALVGASLAFIIGLIQYRRAQTWKRTEWVAQEMDSFFNDWRVAAALRMIDYGERRIELYPSRKNESARFVMVRDDDLAKALEHHSIRHKGDQGFTDDEATIRDFFDHLLARLERIQSFIQTGLLSYRHVRPYLNYWAVHILGAAPGDPKVDRIVALRYFVEAYGYSGVQTLFSRIAKAKWPSNAVAMSAAAKDTASA